MRLSRTLSQVSKKLDDIISTLLGNNAPDHKKLAEVYHLSHYLPYKWYDDRNDIYISDTSLGLIFEVMPLVGNSEAMQKELSNIFTQILPEESNIQIMFFASQNIRNDLLNYVYSWQNSFDTLQRLARRCAEFFDTLTSKIALVSLCFAGFSCVYEHKYSDFRISITHLFVSFIMFPHRKDFDNFFIFINLIY